MTDSVLIAASQDTCFVRTTWGEEAGLRLQSSHTGGRICVMDYKAPKGFGPPRHVHAEDDETLILRKGRMAVWSPGGIRLAEAGDIVFLPRRIPHTWLCIGDDAVELTLIVNPGHFEIFFPELSKLELGIQDIYEIEKVAADAGLQIIGPPLTIEEVRGAM